MSFSLRFSCLAGLVLLVACSQEEAKPRRPSSSSSSGDTGEPVSFKDEIAPLMATNCALAACHSSKESNLNFYVTYEPNQIYDELMKVSPTCPSWKFVVPGKPEESMVVLKLDNEQDKLPAECTLARKSEMPPGDPPKSGNALLSEDDRDLFRRWVAQGAKKD